jgi:membrane protease YdiL (CAAX protease family)
VRGYSGDLAEDVAARRPWAWAIVALGFLLMGGGTASVGPMGLGALVRVGASTALSLIVIALGAALLSGRPIADALRTRPVDPPIRLAESASLIIGMLALSNLMDIAIEHFDWRAASRLGEIEQALSGMRGAEIWLALAAIALAPAIAEELLFRGYVLGALLGRMQPAWAVLISAILFGCAHLDLVQGSAAAALGVYLGAVSLATRSIRLCVAAHFCNNALAVLGPSLGSQLAPRPILSTGLWLLLLLGAAGAVVVLGRRLRPSAPPPA